MGIINGEYDIFRVGGSGVNGWNYVLVLS